MGEGSDAAEDGTPNRHKWPAVAAAEARHDAPVGATPASPAPPTAAETVQIPGSVQLAIGARSLSQRIELEEPVRIAYRVRMTLTAAGMAVVRLRLLSEHRGEVRERSVLLDVERPGALSHELERVALVPRGEGRFALELEGDLATWETLQSIVLNPASAELEDVPATDEMEIALESVEIAETSGVSRVVRFVPDWPDDEPRPRKNKDGKRDAVIFAWYVPERMPELGEYYLNLLRYYHADSRIFVGMNHGSDPIWEERLRSSGLDVDIRWARPEIGDYWDTTGFLTALEGYSEADEPFDLVWFAHTKGGSTAGSHSMATSCAPFSGGSGRAEPRSRRTLPIRRSGIFAPRFLPAARRYLGERT